MIPGYGTGQGAVSALWDGARTVSIATGNDDPDKVPSAGDIQKDIGKQIYDGVNPSTPAPAPDPNAAPDPNQPPPNMPDDPFQGL
jgi:hypothetical protein